MDKSVVEIESNFKMLNRLTDNKDRLSPRCSDALYNKKFMLYSRQDSATAEQMLKDIISGFSSKEDGNSQLRNDSTVTNDTRGNAHSKNKNSDSKTKYKIRTKIGGSPDKKISKNSSIEGADSPYIEGRSGDNPTPK